MGASDDQDLTTHTQKNEGKRGDHSHRRPKKFQKNHRSRRDYTNFRCYTCDEKGRFSRDCPRNKGSSKENKNKRHHAHTAEDDEPASKRTREDSSSDEEYVLILSLTCTITYGSNDWLVESGASKHII